MVEIVEVLDMRDPHALEKKHLEQISTLVKGVIVVREKVDLTREKHREYLMKITKTPEYGMGFCIAMSLLLENASVPAFLTDSEMNRVFISAVMAMIEGLDLKDHFQFQFKDAKF